MGTWHGPERIRAMVEAVPDGTLLVLDEAYIEFAPRGTAPVIDPEDPRVIRLRTFSKAYGMAGARVGYAIGAAPLIAAFDKVRNHFGMSRISQAGALAALADADHLVRGPGGGEVARGRIAEIAAANGLTTLPSAANFVAIDCGGDGAFSRPACWKNWARATSSCASPSSRPRTAASGSRPARRRCSICSSARCRGRSRRHGAARARHGPGHASATTFAAAASAPAPCGISSATSPASITPSAPMIMCALRCPMWPSRKNPCQAGSSGAAMPRPMPSVTPGLVLDPAPQPRAVVAADPTARHRVAAIGRIRDVDFQRPALPPGLEGRPGGAGELFVARPDRLDPAFLGDHVEGGAQAEKVVGGRGAAEILVERRGLGARGPVPVPRRGVGPARPWPWR